MDVGQECSLATELKLPEFPWDPWDHFSACDLEPAVFPLTWTLKLAKHHGLDLCRKQSPWPEGFTELGQKRRGSARRALGERMKGSQDGLKALSACVRIRWETGNQKGKTAERVGYEFSWALTDPTGHNGQHVLGAYVLPWKTTQGLGGFVVKRH